MAVKSDVQFWRRCDRNSGNACCKTCSRVKCNKVQCNANFSAEKCIYKKVLKRMKDNMYPAASLPWFLQECVNLKLNLNIERAIEKTHPFAKWLTTFFSGPMCTMQDAAKGCGFLCFAKTTQMCKPEKSLQYNATNYCLCTSPREV